MRLPIRALSCAPMAASILAGCVGGTAPQPVPVPPAKPAARAELGAIILTGEARQGGLLRGAVPAGTKRLLFDGAEIAFAADGSFLIGFDRDAGPAAVLVAETADGAASRREIAVKPGSWRIEQVDASPTANVPSAEFLARRPDELKRIAAARAVDARSDGWRQVFRWPAAGRISGMFGSQRVYRGTPGSFHGGVDIAAGAGAAFYAPADGVVVLAAGEETFTLEGHLLIVDHGMGLNSAFLHCSSLAVKEGDVVRQGQLLGRIGATGRATGPHLHWGMKWRDARIDPAILIEPAR